MVSAMQMRTLLEQAHPAKPQQGSFGACWSVAETTEPYEPQTAPYLRASERREL
jgi:hypothetical protein